MCINGLVQNDCNYLFYITRYNSFAPSPQFKYMYIKGLVPKDCNYHIYITSNNSFAPSL